MIENMIQIKEKVQRLCTAGKVNTPETFGDQDASATEVGGGGILPRLDSSSNRHNRLRAVRCRRPKHRRSRISNRHPFLPRDLSVGGGIAYDSMEIEPSCN